MNATTQARRTWDLGRGEEPLGFEAGDANLYRYVGDNPTDATDPSGLKLIVAGKKVVKGDATYDQLLTARPNSDVVAETLDKMIDPGGDPAEPIKNYTFFYSVIVHALGRSDGAGWPARRA